MKELPSLEQVIDDLRRKPTVPIWPHADMALGLSRNGAYFAAARGEIEVLTFGRSKKAISATLRKRLGIEAAS